MINFIDEILQAIVGKRYGIGIERIGFNDVGTGIEIFIVDFSYCVGASENKQVVAPFQFSTYVGKSATSEISLR